MGQRRALPFIPPAPDIPVPRVSYPPWMDSLYVMSTSYVRLSSTQTIGMTGLLDWPADPMRWALGFITNAGAGSPTIRISPYADANNFPIAQTNMVGNVIAIWLTMFDYGPLIPGQWTFSGAMGDTFRVVEIILQSGATNVVE